MCADLLHVRQHWSGQSSAVPVGVQEGAVLLRQDQRHDHGGTTHQSRLGEVRRVRQEGGRQRRKGREQ